MAAPGMSRFSIASRPAVSRSTKSSSVANCSPLASKKKAFDLADAPGEQEHAVGAQHHGVDRLRVRHHDVAHVARELDEHRLAEADAHVPFTGTPMSAMRITD